MPRPSIEQLQAWAARRPDVLIASEQIERAEAQIEIARARARPSFGLSVEWAEVGPRPAGSSPVGASETGRDALMLMGRVSVPLWLDSYASALDAAGASRRAAELELEAAQIEARALVVERSARLEESARAITWLQTTLLPQAQAYLEATENDYVSGLTSAAEVVRAQRRHLDLRFELAEALAEHAIDWARLEELTARPIPREPVVVAPSESSSTSDQGTPP